MTVQKGRSEVVPVVQCMALHHIDQVVQLMRTDPNLAFQDWEADPGLIAGLIQRQPRANLVAVSQGAVVAADFGGTFYGRASFNHIVVAPEYRGHQLGAKMVNAVLDYAAEQRPEGTMTAHVLVTRENEGGLNFWRERMGFRPSEERVFLEADIRPVTCRIDSAIQTVRASELQYRRQLARQFGVDLLVDESHDLLEPEITMVACGRNGLDGFLHAGSLGLRGLIRHIRVEEGRSWSDVGVRLLSAAMAELAERGIRRVHAFPKNNRREKIEAFKTLGFVQPEEHFLERQLVQ